MTISKKIKPESDLKKFWKLVPKNIQMEESATHKAPALYAEVSGFMQLWYILAILAIGGDIYLALKILMKAGVPSTAVIIAVILDFFVAILPFLLGIKYSEIANRNKKLFYELDSQLEKEGEDEGKRKNRLEKNDTNLSKCNSALTWSVVFHVAVIVAILGIAVWKIKTFSGSVPYNIFESMKGKMVLSVAFLVAVFHIVATEKALIHFIYFWKKKAANNKAERVHGQDHTPSISNLPIAYKADFKASKDDYTELVVEKDQPVCIKYAYIIRNEEINQLVSENPDDNARKGIIAACIELQLR